ncbi:CehA/McbA family metallohydrolase, partial [Candidatus Sumerlaeota bacterium]|nr:CehA/McbA family metallohydrolase [Candidatus Sumerlaeota bacterium]
APVLTFWNNRKVPVAPPYLVDASEKVSAGPDSPRPRFFHTLNQEDEREGGALLMFNLREPVAVEEVYRLWPSGMAFHRPALQQGAHVEQEKPFWWEAPVNVALGKVASMEVVHNHFNRAGLMENEAWGRPREVERYPGQMGFCLYTLDLYYRYLNLGWDIPVSAGSASGVLANPLGYCRLYVQMDRFDYNDWFDGFRAGRSFATNGPMLFATVNGQPPGSHFDVEAGKPFEARVSFEALCREPLDRAEIVVGGNVAATIRPESSNAKRILGEQRLSLDHSAWIAVRVFEAHKPTVRFAHSNPSYVTVGGQKRRDPEAARFYAQWLGDLLARTEQSRAKFKTARHCEELIDTYRAARKIYQDR